MSDGTMITLPVLPLRDIVVFPHMIVPLFVGREKSIRALEAVMAEDKQIILVTQKEADIEEPDENGLYTTGTVGSILQLLKLPDGAVKVLRQQGRSLLPVGVKAVKGRFTRGDMVVCADSMGHQIACGLVNYSFEDAQRIIGQSSENIESLLGYKGDDELIHRDNLVLKG